MIINKVKQMVPQSAGGVLKWESPLNHAGYAVNQVVTKGQHEVIEVVNLRHKIVQYALQNCTVVPTVNLEGSMDGSQWVVLTIANNSLTGDVLSSVDDYPLVRVNVVTYTDGDFTGHFQASTE